MAAYDWENGPIPELPCYRVYDAMGEVVMHPIFIETECGLVVRLMTDEHGNFLVEADNMSIRRKTETRPAPLRLVQC
jgi:hypothetical protein